MKVKIKKVGAAVLAALTSTEAVKAEKNIAVLVVTRALIAAGASEGIVQIIKALVK